VDKHSTFYGKIESGTRQRQISVYARGADTLLYSEFFEAVECESVNIGDPPCSAMG
jgi:hypothetical protein